MILQVLPDIRAGIAAGQSSKALFDQFKARLADMSYRQFCRYADRIRQSVQNPDLEVIQPKRAVLSAPREVTVPTPASAPTPALGTEERRVPAQASTPQSTQENHDGPKAPPRPRRFVRLGGLPDDNKDKLI